MPAADLLPAARLFVAGEWATYAVAHLPAPAKSIEEGGWPEGQFYVVMDGAAGPTGQPRAAIITGQGVAMLRTGCFFVSAPAMLTDDVSFYGSGSNPPGFLLPPLPQHPGASN
jgi:hypothetical protein